MFRLSAHLTTFDEAHRSLAVLFKTQRLFFSLVNFIKGLKSPHIHGTNSIDMNNL